MTRFVNFADCVAWLRIRSSIGFDDLREKLGLDTEYLTEIIEGRATPTESLLSDLAIALEGEDYEEDLRRLSGVGVATS